ncbi:hypothetical protein NF865_02440 [Thermococcus aggregans]|uniref:DUF1616 domain-containing protein n=1 Tax=Thermococcus aggregans TaxID=110163 RepID=A0A9E7SPA4_THEAG|nr:hypothetical protein [Thermococcus aggregans]USS41095.1 hypothetical protein NF865_02440 [Thermococcus aggregans]
MRRELLYVLVLASVIALGTLLIVYPKTSPGYSLAYFDNLTTPNYIIPNQTYEMSFVIESHERERTKYEFEVFINNHKIKSGEVVLEPQEKHSISFNFSVSEVEYEKITLETRTEKYLINGSIILGTHSSLNNASELGILLLDNNLTLNLAFPITGTPLHVSHVRNISEGNETLAEIIEYDLTEINETYILTRKYSKVKYVAEPVKVKVIVKSQNEEYPLLLTIPIKEG